MQNKTDSTMCTGNGQCMSKRQVAKYRDYVHTFNITDSVCQIFAEEEIIIKLSKLDKEGTEAAPGTLASADTITAIEQVTQELVGDGVIVEAQLA
jgi:hypothetical protein